VNEGANVKQLGRYRIALTAVVAASAAGMTLAVLPAAQAVPTASATAKPVLIDCSPHGSGSVEPHTFTITCADGNDFLAHLTWTHWAGTAGGKGTEYLNNCKPSCVAGHVHKFVTLVGLFRVRAIPHGHGQRYYTRMVLSYTGKVPHGFHRHRTIKLWLRA
jgi:hypothetical protein